MLLSRGCGPITTNEPSPVDSRDEPPAGREKPPTDETDKLFQPFFTTKPTGEGTGLGLSITYDIVTKAHGGTIAVDSNVGEYREFTIRLPRKR